MYVSNYIMYAENGLVCFSSDNVLLEMLYQKAIGKNIAIVTSYFDINLAYKKWSVCAESKTQITVHMQWLYRKILQAWYL